MLSLFWLQFTLHFEGSFSRFLAEYSCRYLRALYEVLSCCKMELAERKKIDLLIPISGTYMFIQFHNDFRGPWAVRTGAARP